MPSQLLKLRSTDQPQQSRTQDNVSAVLTPIATALGATPILGAKPPAWVNLDVMGGYVSMGSPGVIPDPAQHVDALQYVHFRGRTRNATGAPLVSATMCRLPSGSRPGVFLFFQTTYSLAGAVATLVIKPDGTVAPDSVAAGENISWCVSFLAEQ